MATRSSYLQYLPPVLWGDEADDAEFSLGGLLRIFEKVLTGIPDDVPTSRPALTDTIAAVPRLFDPWTVDPDFLPWLAGFVDLRFPTLQGRPLWGEHQQRAVVARIARTYPRRGQKGGLAEHLELCAVGEVRPRIALDDGSRVLTTTPSAAGPSPVTALVTQGPVLDPALTGASSVLAEGLVRPSCIAIGADGALFLGDLGAFTTLSLAIGSRIWRLTADGRYDVAQSPPQAEAVGRVRAGQPRNRRPRRTARRRGAAGDAAGPRRQGPAVGDAAARTGRDARRRRRTRAGGDRVRPGRHVPRPQRGRARARPRHRTGHPAPPDDRDGGGRQRGGQPAGAHPGGVPACRCTCSAAAPW